MGTAIRVLIVEDSEDDTEFVLHELRRGGYEPVWERVDNRDTMQLALSNSSWDVIIADYSLPGFSGLSAFHLANEMKVDVPFIIASGTIGEDIAVSAMKAGVQDYVMKNNLSRLVPAVERELRDAQVRRERKQAEEKLKTYQKRLRSLASELTLTEERERRRIAVELHDHIGQSLVFAKLKLQGLRETLGAAHEAGTLTEICDVIDQIIEDTRTLTFDLSSPLLYEIGLEPAISEWLTDNVENKQGITTHFETDEQPKPVSDEVRVLLFKAVRELLVNVIKHAQARNVRVSIQKDGNSIRIIVEDDGIGFSPSDTSLQGREKVGLGLFSIRERLDHLGGQVQINSSPGKGTRVILTAPLRNSQDGQ